MRMQEKFGAPSVFYTQTFNRKNKFLLDIAKSTFDGANEYDEAARCDDLASPELAARLFKLQVVRRYEVVCDVNGVIVGSDAE